MKDHYRRQPHIYDRVRFCADRPVWGSSAKKGDLGTITEAGYTIRILWDSGPHENWAESWFRSTLGFQALELSDEPPRVPDLPFAIGTQLKRIGNAYECPELKRAEVEATVMGFSEYGKQFNVEWEERIHSLVKPGPYDFGIASIQRRFRTSRWKELFTIIPPNAWLDRYELE